MFHRGSHLSPKWETPPPSCIFWPARKKNKNQAQIVSALAGMAAESRT